MHKVTAMTVIRNALLAAALSLALATPASAADKWTRVVTDHFETVGNATGYTVRKVAQTLEHFREVLTSEVLRGDAASPSRMVVMVFKNDVSFEPYKPEGASKVAIGGLAFLGDDPLVALDGDNLAFGLQTVLGVYGEQLSASAQPGAPLWVRAGIGEVYRTFEESKGGRGAILGRPDRYRVEALRTSTPMPLRTLIGLTETSSAMAPGYPQRRMVDAQHWALVHYLSFGPRAAQFTRYLADLRAGTAADAAFQAAFGNIDALEAELVDYVRKFTFPAVEITFDEKVKPTVPKEQTLSDADAESYLSYLLARTRHVDQAKARLERTLTAAPDAARATAILGKLEVQGNNTERGLQLLERAATLAPGDGWVQSTLGQQLFVALARTSGPLNGESLEHTRSVLRRAVELNAGDFVTAAELGWLLLFNPADLTGATDLLSQAVKLAPGRDRYRLWLADALLRQRRFDEAQTYLGPLMGRGGTPEIRAEARRLLSTIAESQKRSRSETP